MGKCDVCGNTYDKGLEANGRMFCCANCARHSGVDEVVDRAEPEARM